MHCTSTNNFRISFYSIHHVLWRDDEILYIRHDHCMCAQTSVWWTSVIVLSDNENNGEQIIIIIICVDTDMEVKHRFILVGIQTWWNCRMTVIWFWYGTRRTSTSLCDNFIRNKYINKSIHPVRADRKCVTCPSTAKQAPPPTPYQRMNRATLHAHSHTLTHMLSQTYWRNGHPKDVFILLALTRILFIFYTVHSHYSKSKSFLSKATCH